MSSNLPPYSTYRTDSKQMMFPQATSHGNILTFIPPGFSQQLSVKFPDSRLAVCRKCKKNFKTRDMCRVRNAHSAAPWTTAYVCISIDDSCLDENGRYIDKPMTVRMVQWQPYCVLKPFDSKTPVCSACKRTNRTRSFCRERHKHRALPWCSVYVLLSALDAADPSTVVAGASKKVEDGEDETSNGAGDDSPEDDSSRGKSEDAHSAAGDTIGSDSGDPGDDINDIAASRTFLAKVSCRSISVHWLELAEHDPADAALFPAAMPDDPQFQAAAVAPLTGNPHAMDPQQLPPPHQYYQPNMNYAAQQHQNALKSRQQYFFQMQQQQQQHPPPPGMPPGGHWQQHAPPQYHMGPPGQVEHGPAGGASAGEAAAAAAQRQGHAGNHDDAHPPVPPVAHPPPHHWAAMYYQQVYGPPPPHQQANGLGPGPQMHHDGGGQIEPAQGDENEQYHTPPESTEDAQGEDDEQQQEQQQGDSKRPRVI